MKILATILILLFTFGTMSPAQAAGIPCPWGGGFACLPKSFCPTAFGASVDWLVIQCQVITPTGYQFIDAMQVPLQCSGPYITFDPYSYSCNLLESILCGSPVQFSEFQNGYNPHPVTCDPNYPPSFGIITDLCGGTCCPSPPVSCISANYTEGCDCVDQCGDTQSTAAGQLKQIILESGGTPQ